jgi:hypothetical protein
MHDMEKTEIEGNITHTEPIKKINTEKIEPIIFTYWKHFTFSNILEYAGVHFIEDNVYTLDRVYIDGEFVVNGSKKIHSTFALDINDLITIVGEIEPIRWKSIDIK